VIPRYVADGGSAKLAHAALPRHLRSRCRGLPRACRTGVVGRTRQSKQARRCPYDSPRKHRITIRELATRKQHEARKRRSRSDMKSTVPRGRGRLQDRPCCAGPRPADQRPPKQTLQSVKPARQPAPPARIADPAAEATADEPSSCGGGLHASFRWPVRGRGDHEFRRQDRGRYGESDGIARCPEGTAGRAADVTASSPTQATGARAAATSC